MACLFRRKCVYRSFYWMKDNSIARPEYNKVPWCPFLSPNSSLCFVNSFEANKNLLVKLSTCLSLEHPKVSKVFLENNMRYNMSCAKKKFQLCMYFECFEPQSTSVCWPQEWCDQQQDTDWLIWYELKIYLKKKKKSPIVFTNERGTSIM